MYDKVEKKQTSVDKRTIDKYKTPIQLLSATSNLTNKSDIPLNMPGFSFDDVHMHYNLHKPTQLQALASTQKNQVYARSGQKKHLEHELEHVVQRKDDINTLQVQNTPTTGQPVQRWIKMNNKQADRVGALIPDIEMLSKSFDKNGKPIDSVFTLLTDFSGTFNIVISKLKFLGITADCKMISDQLKNWMSVKADGSVLDSKFTDFTTRAGEGITAEMRYYNTFEELAWALVQSLGLQTEVQPGDTKKDEQNIADEILNSSTISSNLSSLISKILVHIKKVTWEIRGTPAYGGLHGDNNFRKMISAIKSASSVQGQISRLHDMKDLFLAQGYAMTETKEPPYEIETLENKKIKISKETMRYNVGTVDEADPWTLFMRERGRNLWAGPSYTAYQMLEMARFAGGTKEELIAVAYAIFAYWCMVYPHTATPIHTFHEVMTSAQVFGVPYIPECSVIQNASFIKL